MAKSRAACRVLVSGTLWLLEELEISSRFQIVVVVCMYAPLGLVAAAAEAEEEEVVVVVQGLQRFGLIVGFY